MRLPGPCRPERRSPDSGVEPVGQGGRYEIQKGQVKSLKAKFDSWTKAQAEAKAKRENERAAKAKAADEEIDEALEPDDETEDSGDEAEEPEIHQPKDVVEVAQENGGLPKAQAAADAHRKATRAASKAARQPKPETE
ncbi:MAG TPA: hypothetical protein VG276_22850 [Actinomycetes bacterium]|nr:hypothetical protein [Actinomycetes bacterium]